MRNPLRRNHRRVSEALRIVAGYTVTLAVARLAADAFAHVWLEVFRYEIGVIAPELRVNALELDYRQGERVFALTCVLARDVWWGGRVFPAGQEISSSTLAGHLLQPCIVFAALVLAWHGLKTMARAAALVCGLVLLMFVALLDVPLVLVSSLRDLMLANTYAADRLTLLHGWVQFLDGGGRLLIGLSIGIGAVALVLRMGHVEHQG